MKRFLLLCCLCACFALQAKEPFKVIGYLPGWVDAADSIEYDKLTHIHYSFAKPNADGSLKDLPNARLLTKLVKLAHRHQVKVGIAIGGWNGGDDSAFEQLAANADTRQRFVGAVMTLVKTYQLDGVDMDWEYPDAGASAQHYLALMKALSGELRKAHKFLSAAVVSHGKTGEGIKTEVTQYLDMLNIMAYDGGSRHGLYSQALTAIDYWSGRGFAKSKLILGVPFYGRDVYTPYKALVKKDPQAPNKDRVGNIRYNGIDSMKQKTRLALERCGGLMIWEISQDTQDQTSLLRAIDQVVKNNGRETIVK